MFENAKWITRKPWTVWRMPEYSELPPAPFLIKDFMVDKPVETAILNITAYGQGAYFLNGCRITDSYLPTVHSVVSKTLVYSTYNITADLRVGKNRLGVVIGNDFQVVHSNPFRGYVRMIAQLDISYSDGSSAQIVSDTSWKTADSPTLFDLRRCGEKYDARLKSDGWSTPEFDTGSWQNAFICKGLGGKFRQKIVEPIRIQAVLPGKEIADGVFDFGTNTCGWVRIKLRAKSGSEIAIKYAERLTEDRKSVDQSTVNEGGSHTDYYISAGDPNGEEWEQSFIYHGFRYVQAEGEYDSIEVYAVVAFTDMLKASSFSCDNELINKIHTACVNSIQTNCHNLMTDCPHREQNFWTGDALASAESINIGFNAYNMLAEWAEHFKDSQLDDGQLPCIVPPFGFSWPYLFANGTDWDSALIHLPYYAFKYSGDSAIARKLWPNMNRLLTYFNSRTESRILNFGLGDWCCFDENGVTNAKMCPVEISDTCYYRIDTLMMSEMAEALGFDPTPYNVLADEIKTEFRNRFIVDGRLTSDIDTAVSMALFAGMYRTDEEQAEADRLAQSITSNGKRLFCGIHGVRTVFDMLTKFGYTQLAFDVLTNEKYPGYASAVSSGLDTLPETLNFASEKNTFKSLNHHFLSHVDAWFYKTLAGVRLNGFGFQNIEVEPIFVNGINELSAEIHRIKVSYNARQLRVESPFAFTLNFNGKSQFLNAGEYVFDRH